ncbi:MAG: PLP-dependent transferase [Acidobacteria bacterium]|nr:PLP-dependent transferase [Acidobacteriota bacterium]
MMEASRSCSTNPVLLQLWCFKHSVRKAAYYGQTHKGTRKAIGVGENLIRLCVGLESAEGIIFDMCNALSRGNAR